MKVRGGQGSVRVVEVVIVVVCIEEVLFVSVCSFPRPIPFCYLQEEANKLRYVPVDKARLCSIFGLPDCLCGFNLGIRTSAPHLHA